MTRPLYEPTPQRTDAYLGFGQRQLFRRPQPSGTITCFQSAVAFDFAVNGTSSINSDVTGTYIVFDQTFVSADATAIAIDQAAPTSQPFKIMEAGWFLIQFDFMWGATGTDIRMYEMDPDLPGDNMASDTLVTETSNGYRQNTTHSFGPVHFTQGLGSNTLRLRAAQTTGISKSVASVMFTVIYLGPDCDEASFPLFVAS